MANTQETSDLKFTLKTLKLMVSQRESNSFVYKFCSNPYC